MSDLTLDQLESAKPVKIEKGGKDICVVRINDEVFAVDDTCSHANASLTEGDVDDFTIECWLHGAQFDLRTGEVVALPATDALKTYPVKIEGNLITVEI
ncbi:MAG: non-heme iron oxygenase ferredoxin subunit [Actinomycetota bacterium]|nr:non-heme iron oxygenase ferredoxin subunit [Actinomycetota bacterium]